MGYSHSDEGLQTSQALQSLLLIISSWRTHTHTRVHTQIPTVIHTDKHLETCKASYTYLVFLFLTSPPFRESKSQAENTQWAHTALKHLAKDSRT